LWSNCAESVGKDFIVRLGGDFEADPQLSFETNTGTYRQLIKHQRSLSRLNCFMLSDDPHDQSRFKRRVAVGAYGRQIWLPTAEDVIIMKLRWARGRDQDDVRAVIGVQAGKLDWPYIEGWCERARHTGPAGGDSPHGCRRFDGPTGFAAVLEHSMCVCTEASEECQC